jgi:hypothetical protein
MLKHLLTPLAVLLALLAGCARQPPAPAPSVSDDVFLDDLEHRAFLFFFEQADPQTGLIADRARADGTRINNVASIASVGFGLTALCIADQRGWIPHEQAYQRTLITLRFLRDGLPHEHGFFYHFIDISTGQRAWKCELSSIDTALLMAGVLTARQYYRGTEIEPLATQLYERVDWPWMLNGGSTLSMGWKPETGFIQRRWDDFSEQPILYLIAMGSRTHPLPGECWRAWKREPVMTYAGRTFLQCPPLFTHQFPHAWIDFRNKHDAQTDFWQNSVDATLAHRQFCMDQRDKFPRYAADLWGITSSDSASGYRGWGGPSPTTAPSEIDGTIVPCAAAGSLPFAPNECLAVLRNLRYSQKFPIWTHYGFVDAFNPHTGWVDTDVIGIDLGITLLMAENYRTGMVWEYFMRNPEIQRAMRGAGFVTNSR